MAVAVVAATGCTASDNEAAEPATAPTDADIGFARDMAAHHAQAVDMAERIRRDLFTAPATAIPPGASRHAV